MSRNNELIAKMDRHWRLMEYCRACMERLKKNSGSLEAVIEACLDLSIRKFFPKGLRKL